MKILALGDNILTFWFEKLPSNHFALLGDIGRTNLAPYVLDFFLNNEEKISQVLKDDGIT